MTAALEGGEWSAAGPGRNLPPGKNRYPLYRRLGGPQGRSGREENLVPTGFRSPNPLARTLVATPTKLLGPPINISFFRKIVNKLESFKVERKNARNFLCYVTRCKIYGILMIAIV